MRSGAHELWEASLRTSRRRAERNAALARMARAVAPFHEVFVRFGADATKAMQSLGRAMKAMEAANRRAQENRRR